MSSGDVIAQCWLEKVKLKELDFQRTARFGIIGITFVVRLCKNEKCTKFTKFFIHRLGTNRQGLVFDYGKTFWFNCKFS